MDTEKKFNIRFTEFMAKFDAGDGPMVNKLLSDIFKYPLSVRVYMRIARATKPVPRTAMNDCNSNPYAIDEDLERFVKVGLVKRVSKNMLDVGGYVLV